MSHLAALVRAPFDLGVFADAARQRLRRTLAFLALLVLLATAVSTTWAMRSIRELVRQLEPHLDALPTIVIEKGQARADVEQPWTLNLGRTKNGHELVFIIDTTGRRTDFKPNERGLFLQRTEVLVKGDDADEGVARVSLDKVPDVTIGPDIARRFIAHWMARLPFYIGLVLLVWYAFIKTVQALLLVLPALLASSGRQVLGFGALFAIGVYALVPALLLAWVTTLVPLHLPFGFGLYFVVAIVYAVLGARRATASLPGDPSS